MKPDLDKRKIFAGVALLIILSVIGIIALTQNDVNLNGATSTETSTEQSSELSSEESTSETALENEYFYKRPENQNRVIAIRALEESELPAPYDFTKYGLKDYKDRRFYALVIIEFTKQDQSNTSESTESMESMESQFPVQITKSIWLGAARLSKRHDLVTKRRQCFIIER